MFLKGLRTQYISRESLNETNEARKNEDINKIIDIGRIRAEEESGASQKCSRFEKALFFPDIRLSNKQRYQYFETCSLSPISSTSNLNMEQEEEEEDKKVFKPDLQNFLIKKDETNVNKKKNEMNLFQELKKFSLLYGEKISSEILPNLPKSSVLACALESLKGLSMPRQKEKKQEAPLLKKIKVVTKDSYFPNSFSDEQPWYMADSFIEFSGNPTERYSVSKPQCQREELRNNPVLYLDPLIFKTDSKNTNPHNNDIELLCENEKKPHPQFNTLGAPFYRRNMF